LHYAASLASALEHLHLRQLAHRDVKAANVCLDYVGRAVLVDFGLMKDFRAASAVNAAATAVAAGSSGGSESLVVVEGAAFDRASGRALTYCGTSHAMAPEVISRQGHGCCVDWWGLGVLLWELLAGMPPFGYTNDDGDESGKVEGATTAGGVTGGEEVDLDGTDAIEHASGVPTRRAKTTLPDRIAAGLRRGEPVALAGVGSVGDAALVSSLLRRLLAVDAATRLGRRPGEALRHPAWDLIASAGNDDAPLAFLRRLGPPPPFATAGVQGAAMQHALRRTGATDDEAEEAEAATKAAWDSEAAGVGVELAPTVDPLRAQGVTLDAGRPLGSVL
jgi:serine/threonine protein kinase